MGRGTVISDTQIETIKATFAETGDYKASALAAGVGWATAKKYAGIRDEYESVRAEKRVDIIAKIAEAQIKLLDAMTDSATLLKASLQEKSVAFGIVSDKLLLMSGQATQRTETITDPSTRLTPEEMEQAARIREKHAALVPA